ncbi:hypothetical protein [Flavobacterium luteum]|uniref:Alpha-L-rhamnosidase six-hairpin glycosidase domain-containing protein n=1 Tax=Flavobacterium luteum TaxID=2026654 RepID=A0A7J5A8Y5_9FLAO|nr:hypothetical protein [Flavobacterium luteum]KAB1154041.1 hypothetical protein F6464_13725 [Flavobacterium luteum]
MKKYIQLVMLGSLLISSSTHSQKFLYENGPLVLKANSLEDGLGQFVTDDLPNVNPKNTIVLKADTTPITKKMWNIALHDVELNLITNDYGTYFAAGRRYTDRVYVRDISFAGILGLNAIYPQEMMKSLRVTRDVVEKMGYKVSTKEVIKEIDAPWDAITDDKLQIMAQFKSNSITRRTDDVVWIWAVDDLFKIHPEVADWQWFYTNGKSNFEALYAPWFDKTDGLYRCQNTFQDIQSDGYPEGYSQADCVLLKSTSTNCLYYKAMVSLANAAKKCNLPEESKAWTARAKALKMAILKELRLPEGTFTYYKDRYGKVMPNQHNLGTAFAVLFGIVEGKAAKKAIDNYPSNQYGTPLIYPYLGDGTGDHNAAAWPFCDTFFLQAKEIADGKDYTGYNAALLARTMGTKLSDKRDKEWGGFGSFHEKVPLPSGLISGSGSQLWTSAAFMNVCLRANLVELNTKK